MALDDKSNEKSRREKRKEARLGSKKKKFDSWVQRQQSQKAIKKSLVLKAKDAKKLNNNDEVEVEHNLEQDNSPIESNHTKRKKRSMKKSKEVLEKKRKVRESENEEEESGPSDANLKKSKTMKRKKTKFEEYMEAETQVGLMSAEEDLALERKLAKKLKVKGGKLRNDDDLNFLLEVVPTFDNLEEVKKIKTNKKKSPKNKKRKKTDSLDQQEEQGRITEELHEVKTSIPEPKVESTAKYIAPHLRSRKSNESEEYTQIRRRIRGLLNRMSESNVESITSEISTIYRSIGRSVGSQIVGEEVLASCANGPRGNEQYSAVFSAFVAGMACSVGIAFGANILASLAKCFEDEYLKEDNLSLRNLTLLLSYLYTFGVCSSDLIYDFLTMLSKRLTEVDVSTVLTVLQACGMKLRGDDPAGMKIFIQSVQSKVNELKASSEEGQSGKRMEFMLETICDIKNNKTRPKEDTVQQTRIKKWLQKLNKDEILIRGLKWSKLIDPNKKGQWWASGDITSNADNIEEFADTIDKEVLETQKMLQLAASQRMNTDARRAIFCIIMSGEDYIDAFEKLLRLDLPGKQDREIMRVLVECCLQEKVFNKYYCILASKFCSHDKNHKFTLQYCLWDHYKEVETMPLIRSMHLAKFVAEMIASFSLSIAVLKAVDLSDTSLLTPQRIMHFRMLFEAIFERSDKIIWNVFTRIAVTPEYESLRIGFELFVSKYVVGNQKSLAGKFKVAKKALNNIEGILM